MKTPNDQSISGFAPGRPNGFRTPVGNALQFAAEHREGGVVPRGVVSWGRHARNSGTTIRTPGCMVVEPPGQVGVGGLDAKWS